jgi:hypothetical protein
MKNTISQFTQKCYSDISENIMTKFIDSLEESIDQLIETKCIDAAANHEELSVAMHNLADSVLTDFTFQDYCLLASHFINENNLNENQIWDHLGIDNEQKDLPFTCYHIVVHLLFQLLEKDKFIKLLPSALDEPAGDALDRKHWRQVAEQDTEGFEDPIDYIQLIASLYERMHKLGGFDN